MEPRHVSLDDKYALEKGSAYMSGVQVLVRLPLLQRARDEANGLRTGGFISGYRGSPLGGYDHALWGAQKWLVAKVIHFEPGLNVDLAATSVWGSQQLNLFEGALVDGGFGIRYGKGPGADRCGDVFKHANGAGTSNNGGVLAIVGDDHGSYSSTMPHQSEQVFIAAMIPVVAPATLQDYLDFGLMGFALSRYSGCWVGVKAVAQHRDRGHRRHRSDAAADRSSRRSSTCLRRLNIRLTDPPLEQEKAACPRMAAVAAFARAQQARSRRLNPARARSDWSLPARLTSNFAKRWKNSASTRLQPSASASGSNKIGLVWPLEGSGEGFR